MNETLIVDQPESLEDLQAELERREEQKQTAYREAVANAAQGKPAPTAELESILAAAGKTPAQFTAGVRKRKDRLAKRALTAEVPGFHTRVAEIEEQSAALNAKLEEFLKTHEEQMRPLHWEKSQLTQKILERSTIESELGRTCDCPELERQSQIIQAEQNRLVNEERQARDNWERMKAAQSNGPRKSDPTGWNRVGEKQEPLPNEYDGAVQRTKAALDAIHARQAELAAQANAVWQAKIAY